MKKLFSFLFIMVFFFPGAALGRLKNWNNPWKTRIEKWISEVTSVDSPYFIPASGRIAAVDMDGTLITERPDYFHGFVSKLNLMDTLAKKSELESNPIFKAIKTSDQKWIRANLQKWLLESFAGEDLRKVHKYSLNVFEHVKIPGTDRLYRDLLYLPIVELIELLKEHDFKVYIVTTAQQEIVRPVLSKYLKIPMDWIIGSMVGFSVADDMSGFIREKKLWKPVSHGKGKVLRFRERTGAVPVLGIGNSPNDIPLLLYTGKSTYHSLSIVIDHDDPREYIYSRKEMDIYAEKNNWMRVSMKNGFREIYGNLDFVKWPAQRKNPESGNSQNTVTAPMWFKISFIFLLFTIFILELQRYRKQRKK
ncbi:MAG: haloacid dehalogenase-like hydrolase [Deltaproteobacteria bacterium]|nr:haloacid dehalogenase-like hydrolase [Deltaproteobacteria bacterium]